jgi:hypothetical protein
MGVARVAEVLNGEGVPSPRGKGPWRGSSILNLVSGRRLLGEWQPYRTVEGKRVADGPPVLGFYPAAVSAELLDQVHDHVGRRKRTGGRPAGPAGINALRGLVYDGQSGQRLSMQNTTCGHGRRAYLFVAGCAGGMRVSYPVVLETILATVRELTPADVLPADAARDAREARMAELGKRIAGLTHRQRLITAAIADPDQDAAPLLEALPTIKTDLQAATDERNRLQQETRSGRAEALGEAQTLVALRVAAEGAELRRIDEGIAVALPLVVSRIEVEREHKGKKTLLIRLAIRLHSGEVRQVVVGP